MVSDLARDRNVTQAVIDRIVALSDGVPLFLEELSRTVFRVQPDTLQVANGNSRGGGDPPIAATIEPTIPATLSDSLAARPDQLGAGRENAPNCSRIRRAFYAPLGLKGAGEGEG